MKLNNTTDLEEEFIDHSFFLQEEKKAKKNEEDEEKEFQHLLEYLSESDDEDDKAYYKYLMIFGYSQRIGLFVPTGYPPGVDERGGSINVYNECIEKGIKWEELLNYVNPLDIYPDIIL